MIDRRGNIMYGTILDNVIDVFGNEPDSGIQMRHTVTPRTLWALAGITAGGVILGVALSKLID